MGEEEGRVVGGEEEEGEINGDTCCIESSETNDIILCVVSLIRA